MCSPQLLSNGKRPSHTVTKQEHVEWSRCETITNSSCLLGQRKHFSGHACTPYTNILHKHVCLTKWPIQNKTKQKSNVSKEFEIF